RDHAHVDGVGTIVADPLVFALLENAQQLALQIERNLADLVEKDRAAVRELKPPDPVAVRAGERALHVPEELARETLVRGRRAVDLDERALAARASGMDHVRDELLTDAGLALDQHARRRLRDRFQTRKHFLQRRALADDPAEVHRY